MTDLDENGLDRLEEKEEQVAPPVEPSGKKPSKKKSKFSGAYWYISLGDEDLSRLSFIRGLLAIIALMLQLAVLLFQDYEFVTLNYPSYAFTYVFTVFTMMAVAIYTIVMNFTRNKLVKRIPVERAPKNGYKFFTFIPDELFVVVLFIIFCMEISFVSMHFDAWGLVGMFVCLASLGAQVWSRMIAHKVLKTAERIEAE